METMSVIVAIIVPTSSLSLSDRHLLDNQGEEGGGNLTESSHTPANQNTIGTVDFIHLLRS